MEYIISLLIYISTFGISMIILSKYQSICKRNNYVEMPVIKKGIWFLLTIAAPVFISAVRFGVGTDYFGYVEIYKRINTWSSYAVWSYYGHEPLYLFLNKVAFYLFGSEWGIFFLSSFIIHIFIVMGIDYFKKDMSLPLALFLYYMILFNFGLNGIRSAIAVSIIFFAIRYIYKRKLIAYTIYVLIATMFHNTAIICILFYFLGWKKSKEYTIMKNIIYYFSIVISPILLVYALNYFIKIPIFSQYSHYILNTKISIKFGFLLDILPVIFPIFLFKRQIQAKNESYEPLINLSLLNIPFQYIGYYVNWGGRLALYTNSFYFILIPIVIASIKSHKNKLIVKKYYIFYFIIIYLFKYVLGNSSEAFPYKSIIW